MIVNALAAGAAVAGGAGIALLISYALCRLALNRRRLAAWESAWSLTGAPMDDPSLSEAALPGADPESGRNRWHAASAVR